METHFNLANRFLCFCSGADLQLLDEECPSEINKYAAIGATVLMTGIFAVISSSYALYRVFVLQEEAIYLAIGFGLLWGIMIFNLDRYIVMSMRKEGKFGREFLFAIPRLLIAALISLVIAKPLEVKLFEDRISAQIKKNSLAELKGYKNDLDEILDVSLLGNNLEKKEGSIDNLREKAANDPTDVEFKDLFQREARQATNLEAIRPRNEALISQAQSKINSIYANHQIVERDSLGEVKRKYLPSNYQSQVNALVGDKKRYRAEIDRNEQLLQDLRQQLKDRREQYRTELGERIDQGMQEKEEIKHKKAIADSNYAHVMREMDEVSEIAYSENFITQVEALGDLTTVDETATPAEQKKSRTLRNASYLIMLLFFTIETTPIFVKLITKKGLYDEVLHNSKQLEAARNIEDKNSQFAVHQAIRQNLIDTKAGLLVQTSAKFKELKEHELAGLEEEELQEFLDGVHRYDGEKV